jgi:hypothetical protein
MRVKTCFIAAAFNTATWIISGSEAEHWPEPHEPSSNGQPRIPHPPNNGISYCDAGIDTNY